MQDLKLLNDLLNSLPAEEQETMMENHFAYLFSKAYKYLKMGPVIYRKTDFFREPPEDMTKEELEVLQSACRQILEGKGFSSAKPFTGLGVSGFYDAMRLFHFDSKSRNTNFNFHNDDDKGALDCITFQHRIDDREATLYNFCAFDEE
jgi:hypothetical protein